MKESNRQLQGFAPRGQSVTAHCAIQFICPQCAVECVLPHGSERSVGLFFAGSRDVSIRDPVSMQRGIPMANAKSLDRAAATKSPRKSASAATRKSAIVSAQSGEQATDSGAAPLPCVVRAVMAAPPPTGQPYMPPGKAPRVADRPKLANKTVKKRPALSATA